MRECSLFFCFLLDVVAAPNTALRVQEASDVLRQRIQVKVCMQTHCWLQQEIAACVQQTPVPPRQILCTWLWCLSSKNTGKSVHANPLLVATGKLQRVCNKHLCHQDSARTVPGNTLCQDCATNTCATKTVPRLCQETHCARTVQQKHLCHQDSAKTVPGNCSVCATNTCATKPDIIRVGQNRIYTLYMTVYFVISLPEVPYIHRIYMVLANPRYYARD